MMRNLTKIRQVFQCYDDNDMFRVMISVRNIGNTINLLYLIAIFLVESNTYLTPSLVLSGF